MDISVLERAYENENRLSRGTKRQEKQERVMKVNEMIGVIASCGRRFFYSQKYDRNAAIEVDRRGKVWWIDDYTGKRIYTHYRYGWRGFSHGGTLKSLVEAFRDYISKGDPVHLGFFGPWPDYYCNGDLWGYGSDMQTVREGALRIFSTETDKTEAGQ